MRLWNFWRSLRALRRHGLLTRWNVRAAWLQSGGEPDWVNAFDLTDEEWCAYIEALAE